MLGGSFFNEREKQIGQDKMAEVVGSELKLDALGRELVVG